MHDVVVPKLGVGTTEVDVLEWHVVVGDHVAVGDELVQVESEKMTTALEADAAGVVVELLAGPGDTVDVGSSICRIDPGR
jgi:pyruvate/2-oxoglutarate dehydrogenase complex dihydrolipoamide acyltransferase (E2) component